MNKDLYLLNLKKQLEENITDELYSNTCIQYAEKLLNNNLPVIFDLKHFSLLLGYNVEDLVKFIYTPSQSLYHQFNIYKKTGGTRNISVPSRNLKYIQKWILSNILNNIHISNNANGFVKKKSIYTNAVKHLNSEYILNLDLKDFFPSITQKRVFNIFYYYGYTKELSYIFSKLCTLNDVLPQGAPTSPYLSNICCIKLDKRIEALCEKNDFNYTRYADDITISSNKKILNYIRILKIIIEDEGFKINNKKTRSSNKNQRQEVTGLIINSGNVKIPKRYKREIYTELYFCNKFGVSNHLEKISCTKHFYKEHLYGKILYVNMIEPLEAKKMLSQFYSIAWDY